MSDTTETRPELGGESLGRGSLERGFWFWAVASLATSLLLMVAKFFATTQGPTDIITASAGVVLIAVVWMGLSTFRRPKFFAANTVLMAVYYLAAVIEPQASYGRVMQALVFLLVWVWIVSAFATHIKPTYHASPAEIAELKRKSEEAGS